MINNMMSVVRNEDKSLSLIKNRFTATLPALAETRLKIVELKTIIDEYYSSKIDES